MYPNIFIKMECLDCKLSNYQYCNLVEVSFEELVSENLSVIIHNCLLAKRNCCNICSNTDIICQYSISDLFCINVEKEAKIVNLDQLVPVLTFSTGKFILTGVIAYEEPIASNVLRHYVAYVRSLKGIWNKYNDINIEFSKPEKVKNNLGIKVALLFYIKYESIEEKNQCSVVVHEVDVCEDISNNNSNLLPDCNLEINKIILQKNVEEETYIESETETHIHDISPSNDFQYQDSLMNFDDMIGNEVVVEFVETSIQDVSSSNNLLYEDSSNLDKMIENEEKPECSSVDASLNNSYTETCWSNNESTSSVESSFNVHAFLSYHPWRHLIQNGSKLPPIKLPTQDVKLINTCPIDCIAELLTAAHCFEGSVNYLIFEIGLSKNKKNEIFEIIWEYCMNKSRNIYYTKRMDYCISKPKLYTQTIKTDYLLIDCQDNVIRLFESIMSGELLHSIEKTITCTCNYVNKKKYSIQHINTNLRMEDSLIFELENYLQTYFSKKIKKCYQCQKDARLTYKINSYLCIELETNFIIHKDMQARLNSIPTRLNLCKEEYNLLGVIAFDLPIHENGLLHYYVFIRLPNTEWEERNNLTNIIKRHSKRSTITIKPAILFYARKNVYKRSYDKYL
ncbi:uncharacterized protein LOC116417782 [Nasonia vitripennis]|uniref:Uncharacterized protein n=1 Tax=Nasonia vitripennis TaxID=7425 RepID=A0A7M7TB66_NASVI|nr:uncharacterized protein LOC116417782 [Nasonia vitripennis]